MVCYCTRMTSSHVLVEKVEKPEKRRDDAERTAAEADSAHDSEAPAVVLAPAIGFQRAEHNSAERNRLHRRTHAWIKADIITVHFMYILVHRLNGYFKWHVFELVARKPRKLSEYDLLRLMSKCKAYRYSAD